jgi:serine/threonine-protein kinase
MEYIDGESLGDTLRAGSSLDEDDTRQMLVEVCEALSVLAARHKVHRDIKPDNVIRRVSGEFVLLDFGIVRHLDLATMTMGQMPATPGYAPPEQSAGVRTLTSKCDVFALGIAAFEVMTRTHPFGRDQAAINAGAPPLRAGTLVQCSTGLSDLLGRMMGFRPVWRPSLQEVITEARG